MSHIKTHRGFVLDSSTRPGYLDLPLVDTLYHHMETEVGFEHDYDYVKNVIQAARQILFDAKGQFVLAKQLHAPCSHWVLNFTVSTLKYISGEPRSIELENYRDLMPFHPKDVVKVDPSAIIRENNLAWMFTSDPGTIISCWLGQEDGLTDLVMSLNLIAGSLPTGWHEHSAAI